MELIRLRRRTGVAQRGHKLLKDKLEGLMKEFLELVDKYRTARLEVDEELTEVLKLFVLASLASTDEAIDGALAQSRRVMNLTTTMRRVMSVTVPEFELAIEGDKAAYSYLDTPPQLDEALAALEEFFPKLLKLAELEEAVRVLIREVEKTRRRVNALEYVMIPQLEETCKFIKSKLDELERGNITRLMKVKEQRMVQK